MMLRNSHRAMCNTFRHFWRQQITFHEASYSTKAQAPLRILFCGSDEFSSASLCALQKVHLQDPASIASIDILCRPGKPTGRGLKTIRDVPIKKVAEKLGLRIHERDTFTGWNLPQHDGQLINLIVAVSFGLFIPRRILNSAEFGGINVHPSLLPDFRGAAPLEHTLIAGDEQTGVSLQTLDPEQFDHGRILAQESFPIPNPDGCTYQELLELVTPKAAALLVQGIHSRSFVSNSNNMIPTIIPSNGYNDSSATSLKVAKSKIIRKAPKITPEDRHIRWPMAADDIVRRDRVLGRLWFNVKNEQGQTKRLVLHNIVKIGSPLPQPFLDFLEGRNEGPDISHINSFDHNENSVPIPVMEHNGQVMILTSKTDAISVQDITPEGQKRMSAARALGSYKMV